MNMKYDTGDIGKNKIIIRIIFWLLLILFIVAGIWWTLYLPYDETAVYRSLPSDALIVSEHTNLASRWKTVLRNKSIHNLLLSIDNINVRPETLINDKGIDWVMSHFAMRKSLIAFVPGLGSGNNPAWIFSSWAGGNIQYLKRGFVSRYIRGLKKQSFKNGDTIWTISAHCLHSDNINLSVAVYDGVLLGCLSSDPQAVRYLLGRMRGRTVNPFNPFKKSSEIFPGKYMADKLWVSKWMLKSYSEYNDIFAGIYNITEEKISAEIYFKNINSICPVMSMADINMPVIFQDISSVLTVQPDLLLVSGLHNLKNLSDFPLINTIIKAVKPYVSGINDNAPVFAALFGGNSSGRIMGLRIPSLLVGIQINNTPNVILKNIDSILDKINVAYGWGLIPNRMVVADNTVIGINSTRGGIYNSINIEQRPAISSSGKWLFVASNAKAFDQIVAVPPKKVVTTALWPVWLPVGNNGMCVFYSRADLSVAGKSICNALGIWSLSLSIGHASDKEEKKRVIKQICNTITMLQAMGDATIWTRKTGSGIIFDVHLRNNEK